MSKLALQYIVYFISGIILICTSLLMINSFDPIIGESNYVEMLFHFRPFAIFLLCLGVLFLIVAHVCYKNLSDDKE